MTDDEIDAVLLPVMAKHWGCNKKNLCVLETERLVYRAGMREAARIAREHEFARSAANAIERAAGGEG